MSLRTEPLPLDCHCAIHSTTALVVAAQDSISYSAVPQAPTSLYWNLIPPKPEAR